MDVTDLAVAIIYLLKPHLSALVNRQPLGQSDEVVQQLWNGLQPLVTTNHLANEALNQAVEMPSEEHFSVLKAQLERLFYHNKTAGHRLAYIIGSGIQQGKLSGLPSELAPFAEPDFLEKLSQRYMPAIDADNLLCQVCGRQDETLRAIAFPYVVSFVRATQRRAYSGLWCARHALRYHLLACLLTGTVGWLGIPWGFIYSPITLFRLIKGGEINAEFTLRALQAVAQRKLDQQDVEGAIRVYETGLRLSPGNFYFQQQLLANPLPPASTAPRRMGRQFFSFLGVLLVACLIGMVVGAIDYLVGYASSIYYPEGVTFFGLLLLSIPMVIGVYFAVMVLTQVIQKALIATRTGSASLAVSLSLLASLLLVHAMLVGNVLSDFVLYWEPAPLFEIVWTIGYALISGSKALFLYYLADITPAVTIYFVTLAAALILSLVVTIPDALAIIRWRRKLAEIRQQVGQGSYRAPVGGWFSLTGVVLGFIGLMVYFSFPLYDSYTDSEAMTLMDEGFILMDQGQMDQAAGLMSEAVELAPEDAITHWAYGLVHYQKGECQTALTEFETALSLDPAQELIPTFYYDAAQAHECLYHYEQAFAIYEQAIELDPTLTNAYLDMGLMYLQMGSTDKALRQFVQATTVAPWSSAAYSFLAMVYYQIDREEKMTATIAQAEELLTDDPVDRWAISIFYFYRNDFLQAEPHLEKGLEQDPSHFNLRLQLALLYAAQGKFEEAHQLVDQAAEAAWNETTLHLTRSGIYFWQGDLQSAEAEALEALEINSQSAEAYDQLATIYYFQGDSEQAAASAQQALELDPYISSAYNVLALVDYDQGRIDDALRSAQRSIEFSPKGDLGYYVSGLCYMEQGQSEEAITAFETFLELTWERAFIGDYVPQAEAYLQQLRNE